MSRSTLLLLTLFSLASPHHASAQSADVAPFELEQVFRKGGIFGPSASSPRFNHDGSLALWLWRSRKERRHGPDLWMHDLRTGKTRRLSSVEILSPFQESARKVRKDRITKAREAWKKTHGKKKDTRKDSELSSVVLAKDAEDKKAPRYAGVSSFVTSPTRNELLFASSGDLYRVTLPSGKLTRLTETKAREGGLRYLPDGRSFLYRSSEGLFLKDASKAVLLRQLDRKLPKETSIRSYRPSPDGRKLVLLTRRGDSRSSTGRKVKIARYRNRFMEVREVPRHVSDDPLPESYSEIYVLDLAKGADPDHALKKIASFRASGMRDILSTPSWSQDSKKLCYAHFEQKSSEVTIHEYRLGQKAPSLAYRYLHTGGPNSPSLIAPRYAPGDHDIVFLSELSGYRQFHRLDPLYRAQSPMTHGRFDCVPLEMSKDRRSLFVSANRERTESSDLYRLDLAEGSLVRLSPKLGAWSNLAVAPRGAAFLANYVRFGQPRELYLVQKGRMRQLTHSHPKEALKLARRRPEFFRYHNRHGHEIHGFLFRPKGFRKSDRRPLLIYVYGGPLGSLRKQVTEGNYGSDSYYFARYMTERYGYVTCTIDPRGMSGYGGMFESANFERVGKPQVEDLVDGVRYLIGKGGIDKKRVGIHGWSFGGFQTQMCLYMAPDVFQVGMAGAGPTEWENYNSWYSTGTIGKSRIGKTDLARYSLLPLCKNLKGKLLLVHGMEDSNVLYQDTVSIYRELLKNGKERNVELFLDPTGGHGLGGDVKRLGKARKYESFLLAHLGTASRIPQPSEIRSRVAKPKGSKTGKGKLPQKKRRRRL